MDSCVNLRRLTYQEIDSLEQQGCRCDSWSNVKVAQRFKAQFVARVTFSGEVALGAFENTIALPYGVQKHSGIYNAHVHACEIRDNVYINNIHSILSGYVVDENAVLENVGSIYTKGSSSFGNGLMVNTLNESGACAVPIYSGLTAQVAYAIALGKGSLQATANLSKMIADYAQEQTSDRGYIGKNVCIMGCQLIENMNIEEGAQLEGAQRLSEGTIGSSAEAPSYVGACVVAQHFIMASGSSISDSAVVRHCFVGQGVRLGAHLSAEHSLLFANSELLNGEVCSIFAGPHTISHHKSTLLIAGMFSFYNAGSATNQSNHMYKLGPIHQGTLERGCKTGSGAYLMFPAHVGAFTLVLGSHYGRPDTSALPFSYLTEKEGCSVIFPGINLHSIGLQRDIEKWVERDRRTALEKLDLINTELFTPYTIGRVCSGIEVIRRLLEKNIEHVTYSGVKISKSALIKGLKYYEEAVEIFLSNVLVNRVLSQQVASQEALRAALQATDKSGLGEWVDVAGMLAPKSEIERLFGELESCAVGSTAQLASRFEQVHRRYAEYTWAWALNLLANRLGKEVQLVGAPDIISVVAQGLKAEEHRIRMLISDADQDAQLAEKWGSDMFQRRRAPQQDTPILKTLDAQLERQRQRAAQAIGMLTAI